MADDLKHRINAAKAHVTRLTGDGGKHFINGEWRGGDRMLETLSPADNTPLAAIARGGEDEVDAAATAAHRAFSDWRALSGDKRRACLHAVADAIIERAEEIALVESLDSGQPLRFMRQAARRGAENFRFFADRAPAAADGMSLPTATHHNFTTRMPIGAVGVITPWNTPFMLSTWKIAPALAAGCTVVHKPAEWAPLSAFILADILSAHMPPGVFNMVHGLGEEAGVALTRHPHIKAVAFVGESATGAKIMAQGAPTLKRVHFELGGKNPVVVFADADLSRAAAAATFMIYSLNGERCTSSSRLLAETDIYEEMIERIAAHAEKIRIGHPLAEDTDLGPLIHPLHLEKVCSYFTAATEAGARIVAGGKVLDGGGNYVTPTLFAGVTPAMRVAREEIFGPVLAALPFAGEQEAVALANDIDYGLAAYIWSGDGGRGLRFARAVDAGMVWVNSENNRHLPTPFGGMKNSGIGRDGGDYSFDFYMEQKNICVALGDHPIPKLGN